MSADQWRSIALISIVIRMDENMIRQVVRRGLSDGAYMFVSAFGQGCEGRVGPIQAKWCSKVFSSVQSVNLVQAFFHLHWVHHESLLSIPYTLRHFRLSPLTRLVGDCLLAGELVDTTALVLSLTRIYL